MLHISPRPLSFIKLPALVCLVTLMVACSSVPGPGEDDRDSIDPDSFDETLLNSLLDEAAELPSPQAESLYFEAARLLFDMNRPEDAQELLGSLSTDSLPLALSTEIIALQAEILLQQEEPGQALVLLTSERLVALPQLTDKLQARVRDLRAQSYFDTGQYLLSAQERIYLNGQLDDQDRVDNHEKIWEALTAVPMQQLIELSESSISYEFQAWYELAVIGLRYQYNLDMQQVELEQWRSHWGRHPAAMLLPRQLQLVADLSESRATRIALILPLQSNAGRVVRDGFMSAYYNASDIGIRVPEIRFYDSTDSTNILALHQQARDEGAELIIGPLLKHQVTALGEVRNLGVPTLALNTTESGEVRSSQLYQFALAPENEARQIALKAWDDGHRRVAILSPFDNAGDDYFLRKRNSFISQWEELGGTVAAQELYANDYTRVIENLLDLSDSEYRREQLSDLLGVSLQFTPRRRQDIDFIFLLAQPGAARQIKPSLGYLYAGDLPVYASQDIYSGMPRPQIDTDLNGIYFSDSPWLLSEPDDLKSQTQVLFPQSSALYMRLQAFGVDAFRLYPRLTQLDQAGAAYIFGATGELRMNENRNITQVFSWAQIRNGQPRLLDD